MKVFGKLLLLRAVFFDPVFGFTFGLVLLFSACSKNLLEQDVETVLTNTEDQYNDNFETVLDDNTVNARLATLVDLPGARTPLQVYTRQLTDRAADEQIVISRHPERENLELFLISPRVVSSAEGSVADYRIVAQEELGIDSEVFAVQTQDLTGDGTAQEIFVSGDNSASGLQQVYVFQLLLSGAEKDVIGLRRIFYQESSGFYEISLNDKGYYIVHQRLLDQSSYQLEQSDLQWSASARSFVVRKVEAIDNNDKLSDSLREVYRSSAKDFFSAIDGLWLRTSEVGEERSTSGDVFLYFDSEAKELMVYADTIGLKENDQVIEVYTIASIAKSLWNRLTLNVHNKHVYNIQNYFYVTLEDDYTIKFFALDDESSSGAGSYRRVNAASYQDYEDQSMDNIGVADFQLEGVFTERSENRQYTFQPDKLTLSDSDGKTWEGAYSLFSWRESHYLEFQLFELISFEEQRRSYRIELSEQGGEAKLGISVLLLYPVQLLRVEEINNTSENIIRLEREQRVDNSELENLLPGS